MSAAGNAYDNASMESCFGTVKTELELVEYANATQTLRELTACILYYNTDRHHSSLGEGYVHKIVHSHYYALVY